MSRRQAAALARTSGAELENDDRIAWQSSRTVNGIRAPLPLTEAQAWNEAHKLRVIKRMQQDFTALTRSRR